MLAASLSQNSFAAFAWSGCAAEASASPARIAPDHVRAGISGVNAALAWSPERVVHPDPPDAAPVRAVAS